MVDYNKILRRAKTTADDEFYTPYDIVANELNNDIYIYIKR